MKKIKYLIVGSAFLGALSGTIPPMFINASPNINSLMKEKEDSTHLWKSIKLYSVVRDTFTIEERVQRIEEMMTIDINTMAKYSDVHEHHTNTYTYKNASVSKKGKEFIKKYESCVLTAYKLKGEKRYTIGYGHVIYEDNIPHKISQEYADKLFDKDMDKFNVHVRELLSELDHRFIYTQSFVDGLTSLTYNCGPDGVRKTRFWKRMKSCRYDKKTKAINKKDLIYAIEAVKTANISRIYYAGHKNRRKAEHNKMTEEV